MFIYRLVSHTQVALVFIQYCCLVELAATTYVMPLVHIVAGLVYTPTSSHCTSGIVVMCTSSKHMYMSY